MKLHAQNLVQFVCSDLARAEQNGRWYWSPTPFWFALLEDSRGWVPRPVFAMQSSQSSLFTWHLQFDLCYSVTPQAVCLRGMPPVFFFFFSLEQFSKLPSSVSNSYLFFPPSIFVAAPVLVVFVKIRKITFFCYPVVNENIAKYWPQDKSLCNFSS